jgi:hypothetical protein
LGYFSKRLDDFQKPLGDFIKPSVPYDFLYNFQLNLGGIAHNVSAVYDVLRRIRAKPQGFAHRKMWVEGGAGRGPQAD